MAADYLLRVRFRLSAFVVNCHSQICSAFQFRFSPLSVFCYLIAASICLLEQKSACGGLSASEVVVVVNGSSIDSRTLANHYVKLRSIPSINVIVLSDVPNAETISVADFREKILKPLISQLDQRRLSNHVQCVAYSADFPTAIDISQDLADVKELHTVFTKTASINGLTYLYDMVLKSDPSYITPEANFYARKPVDAYFTNPGGKETEAAWSEINQLTFSRDFDKANDAIDKLVEKLPYQFPLKYLSAANAAQAGQNDKALQRLEEAIASGWNNGHYLAQDKRFEKLRDNPEFQSMLDLLDMQASRWQPSTGFSTRALWAPNGVEFAANSKQSNLGMRYLLSTVLGVTRGLGTNMEQAIESLKRARSADHTHPEGGFYFSSTLDIRTKTRHPNFSFAVDELRKLGFEADVIVQEFPKNLTVLGAQLGTPNMDWASSSSTLVPGSIVDNLTSLGGVMTPPKSQTPLTHFIAAGAAGSSGTVTEPYSVQFKFPSPYLYLHYAQGLSLAEAFYQSVTGPYQLLIVGDPLCQPFSIAPVGKFDGALRKLPLPGTLQLKPDLSGKSYVEWLGMSELPAKRKVQLRPAQIALQIDGGQPTSGLVQPNVELKLNGNPPGYHEIQVVLAADDPLKQRSMQVIPLWLGQEKLVELSFAGPNSQSTQLQHSIKSGSLKLRVNVDEPVREVTLFHHHEQIATSTTEGKKSSFEVDAQALGLGPVHLQAKAALADGTSVASVPLWIEVVP